MPIKYAANAVLAKARAMYGKRLTPDDYEAMIACRTVGGVADYLKTNTDYREEFASVSVRTLHREQFEMMLDSRRIARLASISRYEKTMGHEFFRYFLTRFDCLNLIQTGRLINTGHPADYFMSMPDFYNRNTALDLLSLAKVVTFDDLLNAVSGTEYEQVLAPCAPGFAGDGDILPVEAALLSFMRGKLVYYARRSGCSDDALTLMKVNTDIDTFIILHRLLRMGITDTAVLTSYFDADLTLLTRQEIDAVLDSATPEELLRAVGNVPRYACLPAEAAKSTFESAARSSLNAIMVRRLRFSVDPVEVLYAYMYLLDTEIKNIVHISEGVRYSLPPEMIKAQLIA